VAVLRGPEGEVLLTRRHADSHQGGLWEFPGGKVEPGESLAAALRRELLEELAVCVESHTPLIEVRHDYGDKQVLLDVHEVTAFSGEPAPQEAQPMRWVPLKELADYEFPAANAPIVKALLG
jgi:8-oxo-dGTP diphosphatase